MLLIQSSFSVDIYFNYMFSYIGVVRFKLSVFCF